MMIGGHTEWNHQVRWLEFKNDGGDEIPAFGLMRCTGVDTTDGRTILKMDKPGPAPKSVFVNGAMPVAAGKYGLCTIDAPFVVKYTGTANAGSNIGAVDNSYEASVEGLHYVVLADLGSSLALVDFANTLQWAVTQAPYTAFASIDVVITTGDPPTGTAGETISATAEGIDMGGEGDVPGYLLYLNGASKPVFISMVCEPLA